MSGAGIGSGAGIWICTGSGVGTESVQQELEQRQGQKLGEDMRQGRYLAPGWLPSHIHTTPAFCPLTYSLAS